MMGYQQAKENLAKLLDKFERELNAGNIKEYNEEAAKTAFIQPLLKDVLGWDVNNRDEVSPEEKTSRGRVDYGLKIDGKLKSTSRPSLQKAIFQGTSIKPFAMGTTEKVSLLFC